MRGTPKAKPHTVFTDRIASLQALAREVAGSLRGALQRQWWIPAGLADRDLLHVPSLHDPAYNRNAANENYEEAVKSARDPGTNGDTVALKMQIDYVAIEERAFRLRHATSVRSIVHAHGRLTGHAQPTGIFRRAQQQVEDVIKAGGT